MKYRKKPLIVEANQWNGPGDHRAVKGGRFSNADLILGTEKTCCGKAPSRHGSIMTLEGVLSVCPGDWIVKGIKGEFYPVKPDIFEATYELVDGATQ